MCVYLTVVKKKKRAIRMMYIYTNIEKLKTTIEKKGLFLREDAARKNQTVCKNIYTIIGGAGFRRYTISTVRKMRKETVYIYIVAHQLYNVTTPHIRLRYFLSSMQGAAKSRDRRRQQE